MTVHNNDIRHGRSLSIVQLLPSTYFVFCVMITGDARNPNRSHEGQPPLVNFSILYILISLYSLPIMYYRVFGRSSSFGSLIADQPQMSWQLVSSWSGRSRSTRLLWSPFDTLLIPVLSGHSWLLPQRGWVSSGAPSFYSPWPHQDTRKVCSPDQPSMLSNNRFSEGCLPWPRFLCLWCGCKQLW